MKNSVVLAFYFLTVNALVLSCFAWGVISLGRGEYPTAAVVLGLAIAFIGLETSLVLVLRGKVKPRIEFSDQCMTIRPDRVVDRLLVWATVAAVSAISVYAVFSLRSEIDIPLPYGNQRMFSIAAIVIALTGIVNLWQILKRRGASYVGLTPSGFDMSQGSSSMRGEWDDVVDFADRRPGKPRPFRAMLFVKFGDGKIRTQVIDSYTPRGRALRRLVRYYWINPDRRDELTDGRAVDRLAGFEGTP